VSTNASVERIKSAIQGNILDSYGLDYEFASYIVANVVVPARACAVLRSMLDPGAPTPTITSATGWSGACLNLGITFRGLAALGVPDGSLATFPWEFRKGMVARAAHLGDVGPNRPETWVGGLNEPDTVHVVFMVHGTSDRQRNEAVRAVVACFADGSFRQVSRFDGQSLPDPAARALDPLTKKRVEHFGFRDGVSQPRFEGYTRRAPARHEPAEPLGVVLLGHPGNSPALTVPLPEPMELSRNGCYGAFRVLGQDVAGFRNFVATESQALGVDEALFRAKLCGRWPNGVPLRRATTAEEADQVLASGAELNDFDFSDDQDGAVCPVGSHIRRANPRRSHLVQRPANRSRRLVRRGIPFGSWLEPGQAGGIRDRGLLGHFLCASLSSQFEAMQYDWVHLGLHDPRVTGTNDPITGTNDPGTSAFSFASPDGRRHTVRGFGSFVETMGGAYLFLPSLDGLRWIGSRS
jgi:deferrochelatase/peroxidase EfeB